jgi:hypothetical protein
MKTARFWSILLLLFVYSPKANAQVREVGFPIISSGIASGKAYAELLRKECPSPPMNATCSQVLLMFQRRHPEQKLQNVAQLADYLEGLEAIPCVPKKHATYSRVVKNMATGGSEIRDDYPRECRTGELWLYDRNFMKAIASLECGNALAWYEPGALQVTITRPTVVEAPVSAPIPQQPPVPVSLDTLWLTVVDSLRYRSNRTDMLLSGTVRADTAFRGNYAHIQVSVRKPAEPTVKVQTEKGSFWTSKKLWVPLGIIVGGAGGWYLGQESVTVKTICTTCSK